MRKFILKDKYESLIQELIDDFNKLFMISYRKFA